MKNNIVNIDINTSEKHYEYAKFLAETVYDIFKSETNITVNELIDLIPPFKKNITVDNWFNAENKNQLEILKIKDLKYILSVNCKKITGKKQQLIDRVWGIHHLSNIKEKKTKKKQKKNTKRDIISVEDSDDENDIFRLLKGAMNIYLKNNSTTTERKIKYKRLYISTNNWVFKEYPNRYEYLGILDSNKLIKTSIPNEIKCYLMSI